MVPNKGPEFGEKGGGVERQAVNLHLNTAAKKFSQRSWRPFWSPLGDPGVPEKALLDA